MELGVIVLVLVGVIALLAYRKGVQKVEREVLEDEVESNQQRNTIRNMSDSELDDKLSKYWK